MRPGGLVTVCNDIVLHNRHRVVELGGGVSTVLLARLLRQLWPTGDVRQVVVEHDPVWAGWVQSQLDREELGRRVAVVRAPLGPHPLGASGLHWYDDIALEDGLDRVLGGELIDLLVVDGPPADTSEKDLARYPALPVFASRLAPGATVVLDDVERPGEQEVLRRWEDEYPLAFERRSNTAGVALGRVLAAES